MKNFVFALGVVGLLTATACTKSSGGNDGVIKKESVEKSDVKEITERYVADDGSSTLVTFTEENGKRSISIASNKMTIKAPETDREGIYEDYNYKIVSKNDSITITQGINVIQLRKARGN